jgi:hypothetical protein
MRYAIPAPPANDSIASEWALAQDALHWREARFGIPANAPIDREDMEDLVNAYLAMG